MGFVAAGYLPDGLIAGSEGDYGHQRPDQRWGAGDVPLPKYNAEVLGVPGEQHLDWRRAVLAEAGCARGEVLTNIHAATMAGAVVHIAMVHLRMIHVRVIHAEGYWCEKEIEVSRSEEVEVSGYDRSW